MSRKIGDTDTLRVFDSLTSTNDSILEAGEAGAPQGTTHIARTQTRGRGRSGHSWWSPPDAGLWMSVLLRPERSRKDWGCLALLGGQAVREALEDLGISGVALYWPNDLKVGSRKIAGVLGEVRSRGEGAWIALGIGVNIDFSAPRVREGLPAAIRGLATSMVECGSPKTTEPVAIARSILERLWPLYRRFEGGEPLARLVREDPTHPGRRVRVHVGPGRSWTGLVDGLGPHGELLVRVAPPGGREEAPPPGGDWYLGRPGVVAVTAGDVTYE